MDSDTHRRGDHSSGRADGLSASGHLAALTPVVWLRRSSLTLTWWLIAGGCAALFFYQWAHPAGSGGVPLAQGPTPSVSVTTGPAAPVVPPSSSQPVRPRVGIVPVAAVSARSSTPAASPSA